MIVGVALLSSTLLLVAAEEVVPTADVAAARAAAVDTASNGKGSLGVNALLASVLALLASSPALAAF